MGGALLLGQLAVAAVKMKEVAVGLQWSAAVRAESLRSPTAVGAILAVAASRVQLLLLPQQSTHRTVLKLQWQSVQPHKLTGRKRQGPRH